MATYSSLSQMTDVMREQITNSDAQAIKALLRLHQYQTTDEKTSHNTHVYNAVGFTKADSRILSSFADFYKCKKFLSPKQLAVLKRKIGKYAGQLVSHSINAGLIVKVGKNYVAGEKEIAKARLRQEIVED